MQVSVSAGALTSVPFPAICVVELQNGKHQFIQAFPDKLSRIVPSAVIAYNAESQEVQVVFICGWPMANKQLKGGAKALPPDDKGHVDINFPSEKGFWLPYSSVRSVSASFSMLLRGDRSPATAKRVIERLLAAGFTLDLSRPRLLKHGGDELLDLPALGNVVIKGAAVRVPIGTAGVKQSVFPLGCPDTVLLPAHTGTITVPPLVGTPITAESMTWRWHDIESIDKSSLYKIGAWQFLINVPRSRCR